MKRRRRTPRIALRSAIELYGSPAQLAAELRKSTRKKLSPASVYYWLNTGRVPGKWAIPIERVTSEAAPGNPIWRQELCPDLYPDE